MKDIRKKGNLLSIKSIEDIYADKQYLKMLMYKLFSLTQGLIYIEASRPTYEYDIYDLVDNLTPILSNNNFNFDSFGLSFKVNEISTNLVDLSPIIWFAYEHVTFCFFKESSTEFNLKRKSWNYITSNAISYVMFRGAEDDVIWIGKSDELEFML